MQKALTQLNVPRSPVHSELRVECCSNWMTLISPGTIEGEPLRTQMSKPGLWKDYGIDDSTGSHRGFDLPRSHFDERERGSDKRLIQWAQSSLSRRISKNWKPPSNQEVDSWCAREALTVCTSNLLRQIEVIRDARRFALQCPLLSRIPENLSPSRLDWLDRILIAAEERWRMVRVGYVDGGILAEVDLTGCPSPFIDTLFPHSLMALKWVVTWCVGPISSVSDSSLNWQAIDQYPPRASTHCKGATS